MARIILTRPAVEAGERLGFLPGDMLAKVDPYLRPLFDALYDMLDPDKANTYMERGTIEVAPLAFMRGRTLNDSFIILDEAQNTSPEQMQMFLTRLGFGSKVVVTGDVTQVDLPRDQASGLIQVQDILGDDRGDRVRPLRPPGRRPSQARAADRRGVQAARRGDRTNGSMSGDCPRRARTVAYGPGVTLLACSSAGPRPTVLRSRSRIGAGWRSTRARRSSSRTRVLRAEGVDDGELGLAFVGPDEMRALKRDHLGIDEATDVLSFPIDGRDGCRTGMPRALGDVVICPQVVGDAVARAARRTGCCTCSATTTARRWSVASGSWRAMSSVAPADDLRLVQLRVRGDRPRAPHAAEPAHPLRRRDRA